MLKNSLSSFFDYSTAALELERATKALASEDYGFYLEYVYGGKYLHARHTELMCSRLEAVERGELKRLIICLPPRHSKSRSGTESFPAWFMGRKPSRRVMIAGYNASFAKKFGRENRAKVRKHGPDLFGMTVSKESSSVTNWKVIDSTTGEPTEGGMISQGINGQFTGEGADLLMIDDPYKNRREADSPTTREMVWNEYKDTLLTRLSPEGAIVIIMTRWHEDDLVGRLLAEDEDSWEVLSIPCEAEDVNDPLGREIGEPLWPEYGFDKEWMERIKKDRGTRAWNALYQQRPSVKEGTIFKRTHWRFFKVWPEFLDKQVQSWDCTFKDKDESDYVVGLILGQKGPNYYVMDRQRAHLNLRATMQAIKLWDAEYPDAHAKYVEDKANGTAVIELLSDEISGLIPINPAGGKTVRAQATEPFVEAGNVWLPDPKVFPEHAHWVKEFIDELAQFPTGKFDDQVDAFTQAMNAIRRPMDDNTDLSKVLAAAKLYR